MKTKRKIKKCLTELVLIGLFSGAVTTLANASDIVFSKQIKIFTELDYLIVQDEHLTSSPWSGNFTAINGKAFKVTEFYKNRRPEMNIKTGIALVNRNNLKISIPVHFDNGFKSDLYNASRYLGTGISLYYRKSKDVFLTFEAHDILQINNGVKERPCYDAFRREFHCGTGSPWIDMKNHLNQSEIPNDIKLKVYYFF